MTTISLKQEPPQEAHFRKIEVEKGDILAVIGRKRKLSDQRRIYLGNFCEYRESTRKSHWRGIGNEANLILSPIYEIFPSERFRELELPIITPIMGSLCVKNIFDIIVGQNDVSNYFKAKRGFEIYSELVNLLRSKTLDVGALK